jgi:tetratricopeptide (TPR) repeat protein
LLARDEPALAVSTSTQPGELCFLASGLCLQLVPPRHPFLAGRLLGALGRLAGKQGQDLTPDVLGCLIDVPVNLRAMSGATSERNLSSGRLTLRDEKPNAWNEDNPFYWRFALQGRSVPPDTEEHAVGFYERGEYQNAEAIFRLLVDCFDGYAEGYNYLGLIAYQQRKLETAVAHFVKTTELGRKLFPARIGKKRYWSDQATRPYMRGLRNLALTLNEAARYDEARAVCARLESECGDDVTAASHRAAIYLNTGTWGQAAQSARRSGGDLDPSAGFVEAFALFALGRFDELLPAFLRAALHHPRAARMLVGERTAAPKCCEEAQDPNTGVSVHRSLHAYFKDQPRAAKHFFRALVRDPRVVKLLDESMAVVRRAAGGAPHRGPLGLRSDDPDALAGVCGSRGAQARRSLPFCWGPARRDPLTENQVVRPTSRTTCCKGEIDKRIRPAEKLTGTRAKTSCGPQLSRVARLLQEDALEAEPAGLEQRP